LIVLGSLFLSLMTLGDAAGQQELPLGQGKYEGPIIDAHNHPNRASRVDEFFALVDRAGVEKVIVMSTPNWYRKGKGEEIIEKSLRHSTAMALCSADFIGHRFQGQTATAQRGIDTFAAKLGDGRCQGIGELGIRHYDKTRTGAQDEVILALDDGFVDQALALADRYGATVVFHIEPVYQPKGIDNTQQIKAWYGRICRRYTRARLISAHTGMMGPADLEEILLACGNVYADFKFMHSKVALFGFQDLHPINDLDYRFFEPWAALIEKYPDRFIFGSDWKYGRKKSGDDSFDKYLRHIKKVRRMIGSLRPDVWEKVLYTNAKRVFGLE
jgi:predicted TIM-barrel fold metal-dependent hydrolase